MALRQWPWIETSLPFIGMISAVSALAINMIISKMAMSKGTSFYSLSVYSNGLATLILFPTAFVFHRSKVPPLNFPVLWRIFLLAVFGYFAEISSYAGINYSSPTLGTALLNLVPAFTFILAIIFRMEEVDWRRISTIAKMGGTVISIAGAFVVTFYKGPALLNRPLSSGFLTQLYLSSEPNWILGGVLLSFAAFLTASWCILQVSILQMYPAEMLVVAFYCLFVTIQSSLVSLFVQRDAASWKIETVIGLTAILYAAMINIAYRLYVTAWCIWKRGPLYVSLFKPSTIIIAVFIGVVFMNDVFYLGSLLGALILSVGFYGVIWGKAKEGDINRSTDLSDNRIPLLQENIQEV
ncbi:WAT1-related protein At3g28050-like [Henckelia pumila]|uniref:WAT1-related protein At3g28050-like n=1 Tax=Henckelia pumila TaxID=405737 RepID=UPI003C6E45BF